ncbi:MULTISPECIES: aminotransferase [unclassified Paracoccus (in: a-proteobacteria)]|uniref:aminotransferase n=1 Tax=unclassified Paracoccus (in: a-proteobacteria) TaxID=2688777 RepID=UPI0015FF18D8|nr:MULTISPECIES: aminotransferase [unclassified Paracoccus (in: a-proteobacteria)]MBB1490818.1 aminotransferase [Paracoccus sp. MC1854]MBB1497838.1 aminotransferase [Paracoccus sp. MC1862]QQO46291.1 aminotransferase [Paracoccus sp. MC1862]
MMLPLNPDLAATFRPPVMEARRWLQGLAADPERPLINVSQAAPVDPPPEGLRQAIADASLTRAEAHLYGPVLGNPDLREAVAAEWSRAYGGSLTPANVAITQGCNQAFCAAIATVARAGDEVIIPVPWYFNHKMWLDMQGIRAVPLACGQGMVPDPDAAAALVTPNTRALVLVSPNNPSGAEYPAEVLRGFYDLASQQGLALILDETYRDFDSRDGAPHDLFTDPDWGDTLIQLYSFSKAYRLTGHRVGALVASESRQVEVEKVLDTLAICAPQLGQIGALWGMQHLRDWLAGERQEILCRRAAMTRAMAGLEGWRLKGCGAYFAWAEHPFAESSAQLAPRLVHEAGVLLLPGTMFMPEGDPEAARHVRIAFANVDEAGIAALAERLAAVAA